jgi:hypothetical protein
MGIEILLGASVPNGGLVHLSGSDIEGGNQRLGAMADVLKLDEGAAPGLHGDVGHRSLQGLNSGHLVQAEGQFAAFSASGGLLIDVADVFDFVSEGRVGGGLSQ